MKFLGKYGAFFFNQKTHFSVGIFEMGFMQYILISSAGRPFILVPLVPVDEDNIYNHYIPIGIFARY